MELQPGQEASFEYTFYPSNQLAPRDFILAFSVFYKTNTYFSNTFFNGTVEIVEPQAWIDSQLLFLVLLAVVGVLVTGTQDGSSSYVYIPVPFLQQEHGMDVCYTFQAHAAASQSITTMYCHQPPPPTAYIVYSSLADTDMFKRAKRPRARPTETKKTEHNPEEWLKGTAHDQFQKAKAAKAAVATKKAS